MKKSVRAPKGKAAASSRGRSVALAAATLSELPAPPSAEKTAAVKAAASTTEQAPALTGAGPLVSIAVLLAVLVVVASCAPLFIHGLAAVQMAGAAIGVVAAIALAVIVLQLAGRITAARAAVASYEAQVEARTAQMQRSAAEFAAAAARTDRIMETVTQGLFLIDPGYRVDGRYSAETDKIFRASNLEGTNILELLKRILTERMYAITRDYLALLFDATKKERTVLRVNPLTQVEVSFPNPDGGYISRYLSMGFRRIVADGVVTHVFVAVEDITTRVELETTIRESESTKNRQIEFLLGVMHVAPKNLDEFIQSAREQVSIMNTALRTQDFAGATSGQLTIYRQRLQTVFRAVHTIKGHAQTLKLTHFVEACHEFESKVDALRKKSTLVGDDFLSVVIAQTELAKDVEDLAEVRVRFLSLRAAPTEGPALERRATDFLTSIANLIESTSEGQQKKVRLETLGFEITRLPDDVRRVMRDVVIQLSRNSVTHGVELPEERIEIGKLPVATITIAAKTDAPADQFAFTFRDDGRGLDPAAIKESAVKKGLIDAAEAAAMPAPQAIGLIFRPGFSTASAITEDAGRGFGMNIVKELVVDRLSGKISMRSEPGRFTEFSISIPLTPQVVSSDNAARELLPA